VTTWSEPHVPDKAASRVTFLIEPLGPIVRLTVSHEDLATDEDRANVTHGWSAVLSNLKSLLETGRPLPRAPWEAKEVR
jgi:uncharacterized protein YndB with AHSA1/START domain